MTHLRRTSQASFVLLLVLALAAPAAQAQGRGNFAGLEIPVTGDFTNAAGLGSFTGVFDLQRFAVQGDQIFAVGTLTGSLTDAAGNVLGSIVRTLSIPLNLDDVDASCDILHLDLGPLDLDLLGLVVHLDPIVLDITAEPGSGNLLGNLLCTVTRLLDGPGSLLRIANILTQILSGL